MENLEKICKVVQKELLDKRNGDNKSNILIITISIRNNEKIEVIFSHPFKYTLIAYRCIHDLESVSTHHHDDHHFETPYHIVFNGKNFKDGLKIIKDYFINKDYDLKFEIIEPKKVGSADGYFYFA